MSAERWGAGPAKDPATDTIARPTIVDEWTDQARQAIGQLARSGQIFDASMVAKMVGPATPGTRLGSAMSAAKRSGVIVAVGSRIAADGRPRRLWADGHGRVPKRGRPTDRELIRWADQELVTAWLRDTAERLQPVDAGSLSIMLLAFSKLIESTESEGFFA